MSFRHIIEWDSKMASSLPQEDFLGLAIDTKAIVIKSIRPYHIAKTNKKYIERIEKENTILRNTLLDIMKIISKRGIYI